MIFSDHIARGFLIIATPFASGFDHLRIADEVQFKFDRCIRVLRDENVSVINEYKCLRILHNVDSI